ncbi:MAG: protein phosphatase CheZ [Pseudolabrys sp.]
MQRKVFRIEQMIPATRRVAPAHMPAGAPPGDAALRRDLFAVQEVIARHKRELAAFVEDGKDRRLARAAGELGAAIEGMRHATQGILDSAERIDDGAKSLAAALKGDYERGLAQEIQEHVTRLYEACNFQDLAGQRIGKVMEMLGTLERRVDAMLARCNGEEGNPFTSAKPASELINGPRLEGDAGHASQRDVDLMFNPAI